MYFRFMVLSRSFFKTTMKANRICPCNRYLGKLAGKCINNRTRGRSRKGAELIVHCYRRRHLWGSKLHVGYSFSLRLYVEWSAIWGRYQTICVRCNVVNRPSLKNDPPGHFLLNIRWKWPLRSLKIDAPVEKWHQKVSIFNRGQVWGSIFNFTLIIMIYKLKLGKWHAFNFNMTKGGFSTLKFDSIFLIDFTCLDLKKINNDEKIDLLFH